MLCTHESPAIATQRVQAACDSIAEWCRSVKLTLNASKSKLVIFDYRKRRAKEPEGSVTINGTEIRNSRKATFLGLLLDDRLRWTDHIASKCESAVRAMQAVRRSVSLTWGLSNIRLSALYYAAIEPIILYCSSVWAAASTSKKNKRLLRSSQRKMAQMLTKTFRTSSTEAILVLANMIPIDYRVQEVAAVRALELCDTVFSPSTQALVNLFAKAAQLPAAIERNRLAPSPPPWLSDAPLKVSKIPRSPLFPMSPQSCEVIRAYTDGSRMSNGRVGFGVAFVDLSNIVFTISSRLPPGTTIFQAEGLAILEAVKWFISHGTKYATLEIYSDSAAALTMASTTTGRATEIFIQIRAALRALAGSVCLFWILSHVGHPGNEFADELAKKRSMRSKQTP